MKPSEYTEETIGERIRDLRTRRNFTQEQLGKLVCVSADAVGAWEKDRNNIDSESVVKLADALGCSCDWILTGKGTRDLTFSNETGLSGKVIEILKSNPSLAKSINTILKFKDSEKIFEAVTAYLLLGNEQLYGFNDNSAFFERDSRYEKLSDSQYWDTKDNTLVNAAFLYDRIDSKELLEGGLLLTIQQAIIRTKEGGKRK